MRDKLWAEQKACQPNCPKPLKVEFDPYEFYPGPYRNGVYALRCWLDIPGPGTVLCECSAGPFALPDVVDPDDKPDEVWDNKKLTRELKKLRREFDDFRNTTIEDNLHFENQLWGVYALSAELETLIRVLQGYIEKSNHTLSTRLDTTEELVIVLFAAVVEIQESLNVPLHFVASQSAVPSEPAVPSLPAGESPVTEEGVEPTIGPLEARDDDQTRTGSLRFTVPAGGPMVSTVAAAVDAPEVTVGPRQYGPPFIHESFTKTTTVRTTTAESGAQGRNLRWFR